MVDRGTDPSEAQRERLFLARGTARGMQLVAGLLLLNAVVGPLSFYLTTGVLRPSPALLGGLVGLAVLALVRKDRVRWAMVTFIWGGTLIPVWGLLRGYGLLDGNLLFLPVASMGAGFMLGTRHAVVISALACTTIGWVFLQEIGGHGFPVPPVDTRTPHAVSAIFAVVLGAIVGARSTRAYREQYERTMELSRDLEAKVAQRTAELNDAVQTLSKAQDELVHAGTLASLGVMVAGVSHELNTPIGNALMASTTAQAKVEQLARRFGDGALTRSEFQAGLREVEEALGLCTASVSRAAELVASFKQVAVDRVSERRRAFRLSDLVEDTLATLRPGMKGQPWALVAEVPGDLVLDSFPGPLGQVLTNLVQNALLHAFEGRERGEVRITATGEGDRVVLRVRDDGIGIAAAVLPRIFEPFFTTKLGRGGSGLGLSICFRLASRVLGGELSAESRPGEGCTFQLVLPRVAPALAAAEWHEVPDPP